MRRLALTASLLALLAAAAPVKAAPGDDGTARAAAPKKKQRPACVRVKLGPRTVCVRVGQSCRAGDRAAYLDRGLDCVLRRGKRRIAKATPAAIRQGTWIALPPSGQPTTEQAFQAFDAAVGPIPGVNPPAGTVGETRSGTTALRWMDERIYELSTAQQLAVTRASARGADGFTVPIENGVADPPPPPPEPPPSEGEAAAVRARAAQVAEWRSLVAQAVAQMAARGVVLTRGVDVSFAPARGDADADAYPMWLCTSAGSAVGHARARRQIPDVCRVRIFPSAQGGALPYRRMILLHELTHCYQFQFVNSLGELARVPQWFDDGTAEFVAHTISQAWSGTVPEVGWYPTWLRKPEKTLFRRTYDAVGFWLLLAQEGVNVYGLIGPGEQAGATGGSQAIYDLATAGIGQSFVDVNWGPTVAGLQSNPTWRLDFPWVPRLRPPIARVGNGGSASGTFQRYGASYTALELSADITTFALGGGARGRLLDDERGDRVVQETVTYCTRAGGCTCPGGGGEPGLQPLPRGLGHLGVAGVTDGAWRITGRKLECREEPDEDPPPRGGTPGTSGAGLEVRDLDTNLIGRVTTGTCSVRGTTFVATGSGSAGRFLMRIAGATRPGSYVIPIGSGSTFVQVGNFTSNRPVQGFPGGGSADLARVRVRRNGRTVTRWRISVGVTPLFSTATSQPAAAIIPSGRAA